MHSFILFNIFAIILFSLGECNKHRGHSYKEADCSDVMQEVGETMRGAYCAPKLQHIELEPMPGFKLIPTAVFVKKCTGNCRFNTCLATLSQNVTHYIRRMKRTGRMDSECLTVQLEEDLKCKCMCNKTSEDCSKWHEFDKPTCSCKCKNRESERQICEKRMGMKWVDDICECRCMMMNHTCTSGGVWNPDTCNCDGSAGD